MITVNILATCRKPELIPFTTLVFNTLRVGFPTAKILVSVNPMDGESQEAVFKCCERVGAEYLHVSQIHHCWIEGLIERSNAPFFLCDSDLIFHDNCERWISQFAFAGPLAGWRIPEWRDEFSGAITRARLHTSLLYVDPIHVRSAIKSYESRIADTPFTPKVNLIHPLVLPFKQQSYFYDTCSLLYHAIGGTAFSNAQLDCYSHLNFGTIPDVVLPRLNKEEGEIMRDRRSSILAFPERSKGVWREQMQYYASKPA